MIKKSAVLLTVFLLLFLSGCPEGGNTEFTYDPDPIENPTDDPSETVIPAPAEDLYIVANVAGKIAGFQSSAPEDFAILAEDASTEERYSEIRISPDLKNLLYARVNGTQKDLVLLNLDLPVSETNPAVIQLDVESNESEFIDDNRIIFSDNGSIYVYEIGSSAPGNPSVIIPHLPNRCNHWMQLSPDLSKIVFKDQDASSTSSAVHAWTPANFGTSTTTFTPITTYADNEEGSDPVGLYDSFFYSWRNNSTVIFKMSPGSSSALFEMDLDTTGAYLTSAVLRNGITKAVFEKLLVSPNGQNLLIYSYNGLYRLDLVTNTVISGTIQVDEIYHSPIYDTKYAAFGSNSLSFVVGTSNWMGIYNTEGLARTNVSIENVIGDEGTLYALHCR